MTTHTTKWVDFRQLTWIWTTTMCEKCLRGTWKTSGMWWVTLRPLNLDDYEDFAVLLVGVVRVVQVP